MLLHCDDQWWLGERVADLSVAGEVALRWAEQCRQAYHTSKKTVAIHFFRDLAPPSDRGMVVLGESVLPFVSSVKYLGVWFSDYLDMEKHFSLRLQAVRRDCLRLSNLARDGRLPWPAFVSAVVGDAESKLAFSCLFFLLVPDWSSRVDSVWFDALRLGLGAPRWVSRRWLQVASGVRMRWSSVVILHAAMSHARVLATTGSLVNLAWRWAGSLGAPLPSAVLTVLDSIGIPPFALWTSSLPLC